MSNVNNASISRQRSVMTNEEFIQYLQDHHRLFVVQVTGDGNCLYYALATAFYSNQKRQMEVRQAVAQHVRSNPLDFYEFADEELSFEAMIFETTVNRNYSYEFQLKAASEAYSSNIIVYSSDGSITSYPHNRRHPRNVLLSFHNNNHYNLLLEIVLPLAVENRSNEIVLDVGPCANSGIVNSSSSPLYNKQQPESEDGLINQSKSRLSPIYNKSQGESEEVLIEQGSSLDLDSYNEESQSLDDNEMETEHNNDEMSSDQSDDDEDETMSRILTTEMNQMISNQAGFNFLANKLYQCGRNFVYHIFIIPKLFAKNSLHESINNVEGRAPMFHTICYTRKLLYTFTKDKDIQELFVIWVAKKTFPLCEKSITIRTWYSNFMIVYVLLTAVKHTWMGETIKFLFDRRPQNLVPTLLTEWWRCCKTEVELHMNLLNQNGDLLMCGKCRPDCEMRNYYWHINLDNFRLDKTAAEDFNFSFSRTNNFKQRSLPDGTADVVLKLQRFYLSGDSLNSDEKMDQLFNVMDNNSRAPTKYYCYLILLLDGEDMTADTKFEDVMNDDRFFVSLYVGQTKDQDYRHSHFLSTHSPIFRLLTSTSKVFLLRSKAFKYRNACTRDEGIVCEILQLTLETAKQKGKRQPFILLNKKSETANIFNLNDANKKHALEFCNKEIPIFIHVNDKSPRVKINGSFRGYYKVKNDLLFKDVERNFSKDLYDKHLYF